jgi:hypothetical protein
MQAVNDYDFHSRGVQFDPPTDTLQGQFRSNSVLPRRLQFIVHCLSNQWILYIVYGIRQRL